MKALDTNVLIRFLVKDDAKQAETVYKRFKKAEATKEILFVSALVVLETLWVLESVYDVARQDILDAMDALMAMPILNFEGQSAIRNWMHAARESNADLSDLLIAYHAQSKGCDRVLTFDKKAVKHALFERLISVRRARDEDVELYEG
jgi:predicted nucleic-acid-binding protein